MAVPFENNAANSKRTNIITSIVRPSGNFAERAPTYTRARTHPNNRRSSSLLGHSDISNGVVRTFHSRLITVRDDHRNRRTGNWPSIPCSPEHRITSARKKNLRVLSLLPVVRGEHYPVGCSHGSRDTNPRGRHGRLSVTFLSHASARQRIMQRDRRDER